MPKTKIMIVEDERIFTADLEEKLLALGYNVCGKAYSGKEALSVAEKQLPDLVLMDIKLEGLMDGIEAANLIKNRFNIPVIFLTAFSDEYLLQRAKFAEPFCYLLKPIQLKELLSNIEIAVFKHRMDRKHLQANKLESLSILAGGIAHDFNNLLSVIMGNIELLKDAIKPRSVIFDILTEAEKASLLAKELSNQLIILSKRPSPIKKIGSIGDLVKDLTNLTLLYPDFKIEYFVTQNLRSVKFDKAQMKYALNNLIINSFESMPGGGSTNVRAENFEISSEALEERLSLSKGNYVKLSIRDKGIGIPRDHIPMIFDPYFSTKERGIQKGMGPGLSITYSIIKQHDGHIAVESEVGVGTTFTLYLPVYEKGIIKS